jgi:hypothetical protein
MFHATTRKWLIFCYFLLMACEEQDHRILGPDVSCAHRQNARWPHFERNSIPFCSGQTVTPSPTSTCDPVTNAHIRAAWPNGKWLRRREHDAWNHCHFDARALAIGRSPPVPAICSPLTVSPFVPARHMTIHARGTAKRVQLCQRVGRRLRSAARICSFFVGSDATAIGRDVWATC